MVHLNDNPQFPHRSARLYQLAAVTRYVKHNDWVTIDGRVRPGHDGKRKACTRGPDRARQDGKKETCTRWPDSASYDGRRKPMQDGRDLARTCAVPMRPFGKAEMGP